MEKTLENFVKRRIEYLGGKFVKFTSPQGAGAFDRVAIMPFGLTYWVEMKDGNKPLRPKQRRWRREYEKRGHSCWKIGTKEQAETFLKRVIQDMKNMKDLIYNI